MKTLSCFLVLVLSGLYINMGALRDVDFNVDKKQITKSPKKSKSDQHHHSAQQANIEYEREINNWNVMFIEEDETQFLTGDINVDELIIHGELKCIPESTATLSIKARTIIVTGLFECGTLAQPYLGELLISLDKRDDLPLNDGKNRGLMVMNGGELSLHGNVKKSDLVKLNQTLLPGSQEILVSQSVQSPYRQWEVGDLIAIAPTSYDAREAEEFEITAIDGNTISLDHPAEHKHYGQVNQYYYREGQYSQFDQRAEVVNLSRNIKIESNELASPINEGHQDGDEYGGHVMIMPTAKAYISAVEFSRMGQAGIMARYPFHWHVLGDSPGQYIVNSSIHHSFQRCITVHRTNDVLVGKNTCYDIKGHAIFLEDGTERNNTIENNIVILAKYPHWNKSLLASDINHNPPGAWSWLAAGSEADRNPRTSGYWISHPHNIVRDNIAAGTVGSGFWMAFEEEVNDNDGSLLLPHRENTLLFEDNIAHSNLVGFTWSGAPDGPLTNNPRNPNDREIVRTKYRPYDEPTFKNLTFYKNALAGIYTNAIGGIFDGMRSADNGFHYFVTANQKLRNSLLIGRSQNYSSHDQDLLASKLGTNKLPTYHDDRIEQKGIILYDGPIQLENVTFANYPSNEITHTYNNSTKAVTPIPFGMNFGFANRMNTTEDISFTTTPYRKVKIIAGSREHAFNLRDKDGSLTGIAGGSLILGRRSISVSEMSGCVENEKFENLILCPSDITELKLHIDSGDGFSLVNGNIIDSGQGTTQRFVARTSENKVSEPINLWNYIFSSSFPSHSDFQSMGSSGRTKIGIPAKSDVQVQVMSKNINPKLTMISEYANPEVPIIEMVGHGKNCALVPYDSYSPEVIQVDHLDQLSEAIQTSYYSNGNDFYIKMIPYQPNYFHNNEDPAYHVSFSSGAFRSICEEPLDHYRKGAIESVKIQGGVSNPSVTIKGYACLFGKNDKQAVQLVMANENFQNSIEVATQVADSNPDELTAFKCGIQGSSPPSKGYQFEFMLSPEQVSEYEDMDIYVRFVNENEYSKHFYIEGSGDHSIDMTQEMAPDYN